MPRLTMPWFLPLGAGMAWWGVSTARHLASRVERTQLALLCVLPLAIWLTAQLINPSGSPP
jgi:hypothetical protein